MPPVVDSHQHFWDISLRSYHFMPEGESVLKQNRYPSDLKPLMDEVGVELCVTVQAHASVEETKWLLKLAAENDFVAGVVGWVDLQDPSVGHTLDELQKDVHFKGVRHIWHDEPDEGWIVRPDVILGLKELAARGIPFDFLPRPPHLPFITQVMDMVPELSGVVDHIGKPLIAERQFEPWLNDMERVAEIPGIHCKVSGMITEADHDSWKSDELKPYVAEVVRMFGHDRLMFGSDWPVCTLAGSYRQVFEAAQEALALDAVPDGARDAVFGGNAMQFYGLEK